MSWRVMVWQITVAGPIRLGWVESPDDGREAIGQAVEARFGRGLFEVEAHDAENPHGTMRCFRVEIDGPPGCAMELRDHLAELEAAPDHLAALEAPDEEPPGLSAGLEVWDKSTGDGPFVVVQRHGHPGGSALFVMDDTPGLTEAFRHAGKVVAPWIVRDTQGRDRVLPAAVLSRERPARVGARRRWLLVGSLLFMVLALVLFMLTRRFS
jgi:hypothetical protein